MNNLYFNRENLAYLRGSPYWKCISYMLGKSTSKIVCI